MSRNYVVMVLVAATILGYGFLGGCESTGNRSSSSRTASTDTIPRERSYVPPTLPREVVDEISLIDQQLQEDPAGTLDRLQSIARQHPGDSGVLVRLTLAAAAAGEHQQVLDTTTELFLLDPSATIDEELIALRQGSAMVLGRERLDRFRESLNSSKPDEEALGQAEKAIAAGLAVPGKPGDEFALGRLLAERVQFSAGSSVADWLQYQKLIARAVLEEAEQADASLQIDSFTLDLLSLSGGEQDVYGKYWNGYAGDHAMAIPRGLGRVEQIRAEREWLREQLRGHAEGDLAGTIRWGFAMLSGIGTLRSPELGETVLESALAKAEVPDPWRAIALYWLVSRNVFGAPFNDTEISRLRTSAGLGEPAAAALLAKHSMWQLTSMSPLGGSALVESLGTRTRIDRNIHQLSEVLDPQNKPHLQLKVVGINAVPNQGVIRLRQKPAVLSEAKLANDDVPRFADPAYLFISFPSSAQDLEPFRSLSGTKATLAEYCRALRQHLHGIRSGRDSSTLEPELRDALFGTAENLSWQFQQLSRLEEIR